MVPEPPVNTEHVTRLKVLKQRRQRPPHCPDAPNPPQTKPAARMRVLGPLLGVLAVAVIHTGKWSSKKSQIKVIDLIDVHFSV